MSIRYNSECTELPVTHITLNSYAKINLSLEVIGRRTDGYHDILSFMQDVDLHDVLFLGTSDDLFCTEMQKYSSIHCNIAGVHVQFCININTIPLGPENLALRGAEAVLQALRSVKGASTESRTELGTSAGGQPPADRQAAGTAAEERRRSGSSGSIADGWPVRESVVSRIQGTAVLDSFASDSPRRIISTEDIQIPEHLVIGIDKRLPVAAGIAGGSGNAAVCMLGINRLCGSPFTLSELIGLGASVGADVPFSLLMNAAKNREALGGLRGLEFASTAAWLRGIGDIVDPAAPRPFHVILMNPGIAVSTRAAYEAMDAARQYGTEHRLFFNRMEEYTLANYEPAAALKRAMEQHLHADHIVMSGSGPTMAAYYVNEEQAHRDYAAARTDGWMRRGWRIWCTRSGGMPHESRFANSEATQRTGLSGTQAPDPDGRD